jgi:integrase
MTSAHHSADGSLDSEHKRTRRDKGLYKQSGSKFWWYAISHRGRLIRQSTGKTDIKKAREVLKAKRDELAAARGGYTTVSGPGTRRVSVADRLAALLRDYELRGVRSLAQVRAHLGFPPQSDGAPRRILEAFGRERVIEVTEEMVDEYIRQRLAAGARPATINRETQLLAQAIRPFLLKHRLPVPPMRKLPEENTREGFLTRAEIESVIKRLPPDLRDFTRWAYFTAWRKGEIASLRWTDVDVEGRTVRLSWRRSKNKKARTMTLAGELAAIIERRSAARAALVVKKGLETDRVFFRKDGSPVQDFKKAWASACKASGVADRLFHDLRRSGIRNMTRAGVSRKVATTISGHRTEAIYARYDIADEEDLKDAVIKTQAYVETLPKNAAAASAQAHIRAVSKRSSPRRSSEALGSARS